MSRAIMDNARPNLVKPLVPVQKHRQAFPPPFEASPLSLAFFLGIADCMITRVWEKMAPR